MTNLIGQSLGRYHILEQLGEGGMATVYKAYDTRLEKDVAIKVILPSQQHSEKFLKRFKRKSRALAKLSHPNIVTVLDSGEHEGMPFLVMEYVAAGTLKRKLGQPLNWQDAAETLAPVARALDHAHSHHIVHRDVKPSNILLTDEGRPMLSDFGIAKMLEGEETADLTGTGMGVGTPEYMAPEQVTGKAVDQRADVYALGIVFYEMLTGRKPFRADTPMAVLYKQVHDPLPRPTRFVPALPQGVERVLLKALAKDPAYRYPDMGAFAETLEQLAQGKLPKTKLAKTKTLPDKWEARSLPWILGIGALGVVCILMIVGAGYGALKLFQTSWTAKPMVEEPSLPVATVAGSGTEIDAGTATPELTATPAFIVPTPIDLKTSSKDSAEIVFVPAGEFIMGSNPNEPYFWGAEAPKHNVYLDAFWIYRTEVTNAMYRTCVDAGACPRPAEEVSRTHGDYFISSKYDNYPVIYVTYDDALSYCAWADARLPTEAEWEKAARGTDGRLFPWGNEEIQNYYANFCDVGCPNPEPTEIEWQFDDGYRDVAPAGSFPAGTSPYGAWDMAGNVLEWVSDWYAAGYYSVSPYENPMGPADGSRHPIRGGSWWSGRAGLRPAARASKSLDYESDMVGFRCAVDNP